MTPADHELIFYFCGLVCGLLVGYVVGSVRREK